MSAKAEALPTPQSIAKYVKQNAPKAKKAMMAMMHHDAGGQEVVREEDYKGHHIVVRSTYHIMVDKQEVTGHIMVTNSGEVQYHGLPNHSFDSAIDLVKSLIDNFPEDFEHSKKPQGGGMAGMKMGSHGGMKMPAKGSSMAGMKMSSGKSGAKKASKAKPKRKSK